jgi:hypothetical protein
MSCGGYMSYSVFENMLSRFGDVWGVGEDPIC